MRFFIKFLLIVLGFLFFVLPVYAYIDPGTTSSVFSILASIGPVILVILGFLLWPVKKLVKLSFKGVKKIFKKTDNKETDKETICQN